MNKRLKKIIFDKLYEDLSHVEIIHHNDSIWFIDRGRKYWYFEFEKKGCLWWRFNFFIDFFNLFSLERNEFEPIMIEWVEEVLNSKVITTLFIHWKQLLKVEEVLNSKVLTTKFLHSNKEFWVEEVLNSKVLTTQTISPTAECSVEEVLNSKVLTTSLGADYRVRAVEEVLNSKTYYDEKSI